MEQINDQLGRYEKKMISVFRNWLLQASDKTEKLEFKTQREAAEFVRRLYNENGSPTPALQELYRRGNAARAQPNKVV